MHVSGTPTFHIFTFCSGIHCPFLQVGVVKEVRPYTRWAASPSSQAEVGMNTGIMSAKAELNALHRELAEQGFNQVQSTASSTTVTQCASTLQT